MVNWQVTATTIHCDAVGDAVTIIINSDWSVRCTGYQKYFQPSREDARTLKRRSEELSRRLACEGLECHRVVQYHDKIKAEGG